MIFNIFKNYTKLKIILIIKNKIIYYLTKEKEFILRQKEWENKIYNNKCISSEERFDKDKKEQIKWSFDQYMIFYHKREVLTELLKKIEND